MSNPPTLLFIHGSWHQPNCYDKVIKLLQDKVKCEAIRLPSTTGSIEASFKDDIDTARQVISRETEAGWNVVVIAHSYGGMVGNSCVKGFTKPKDSEATGGKGYVIGLILIASGFTLTGFAFMDLSNGHAPPAFRLNRENGYAELRASPHDLFYHDLSKEESDYWISQLTYQNIYALLEGGEHAYSGWLDAPAWYIGCVEDHSLPVAVQRMVVGMARQMGGIVEHRELQASHSPFLSQPEETAELIFEAVNSFTGKSITSEPTSQNRKHPIRIPRFGLLQISTWFKWGLPLAFGHFVGRTFLIFKGIKRLWRSN